MRKAVAVFLCFAMALGAFTGCGKKTQTASAAVAVLSGQGETDGFLGTASQNQGGGQVVQEAQSALELDQDLVIEKGMHIAVVARSAEGNYWKQMKKNMKETVEYINGFYGLEGEDAIRVTFEGPDSEENVNDQINTIDAVLAENPSALCLAAIDMNSCQAQLETARENGIPVVLFDSKVKCGTDMAFCGTDNHAAGAKAAQELCAAFGDSGKAAVLAHAEYSQTSEDRRKGFVKEIKKNHPGVETVCEYTEGREEDMDSLVLDLLDNQQVKGIFCTSQGVAKEVLSVLEKYPEKQVALVGFDAGEQQIRAISEGRQLGAIVQNVPAIAGQTVWLAVRAALSKQPEDLKQCEKMDYIWVDGQNLEEVRQNGMLYD